MSHAAVPASIQVTAEWERKGRLLMAGLAEEISGVWSASTRVEGHLDRGAGPHLGDLSGLLNWLRRALTTIRTMDMEMLQGPNGAALGNGAANPYAAFRDQDPQGIAVRGVTGPRNNAVHHPEVVDPDVERAIGPVDGCFVIFPRWRVRDASLDPTFSHNGKFRAALAAAYDQRVGGRPVLEPLLDAFAFIDRVAPGLASRDGDGALTGFPLPSTPVAYARYVRLHPDWLSEAERDADLRTRLQDAVPGGAGRRISAAVCVDGAVLLAGWTVLESRGERFVESAEQVGRDIANGYRYVVETEQETEGVEVGPDLTLASGDPLPESDLLAAGDAEADRWTQLWMFCSEDADYYRGRRSP